MSAAAIVSKLSGTAHALRDGGSIPLSEGSELSVSDAVSTAEGSRLELRFADDTELSLGPLTQVQIRDFAYDPAEAVEPAFAVHIMEGLARTVSGGVVKQNPEAFKLSSPMGTAGIRGTTIEAVISGKEEFWSVVEMAKGHTVLFATADGRFFRLAEAQGEAVRFTLGTDGFTLEPLTQQEVEILLQEAEEAARNAEKNEGAADEDHSSSVIIVAMEEDLNRLAEMELLEGSVLQPIDEELYEEFLADMGQSQRLEDGLYFLEDNGGGGSGSGESGWTPQAIVGYTGGSWTSSLGHTDELYINRSGQYGSTTTGTVTLNSDQGSDRIVFFGQGATTVIGGYGSSDTIYCVGDAGATVSGTIYGDASGNISSGTMDDDLIIVRGSDNTSALDETDEELQRLDVSGLPSVTFTGAIYGDANRLDSTAVGGNDTITIKGSIVSAHIAGDANQLDGGGTCGNDIIIVTGDMTNGSHIYGDASSTSSAVPVATITCGHDTITVTGNLTGNNMTISGDVSGISINDIIVCGNDKITVNGTVGGSSTICGDNSGSNSGNDVTHGNDTIIIGSVNVASGMAGDTSICGDAKTIASNQVGGNDIITIGNVSQGGLTAGNVYICGDANMIDADVSGAVVTGGNDTITVNGDVSGSKVYICGDSYTVQSTPGNESIFGNDKITVNGNVSGSFIYGDGNTVVGGATVTCGNDTIIVTGELNKSAVYGDFNSSDPLAGGGNDYISVNQMDNNGQIYSGGGKDTIHVNDFTGNNNKIDAGAGDDMVYLEKMSDSGSSSAVCLGAGNDTLAIKELDANAALTVYLSTELGGLAPDGGRDIIDLSLIDDFTGSATITVQGFLQNNDFLKLGDNWDMGNLANNTITLTHADGGTLTITFENSTISDPADLITTDPITYPEFNIP